MAATWGAHLEIGVPEIDAQHRDIIAGAKELEAALVSADPEATARTLEHLAHDVLVHFETEERWMRRCRYPGRLEHVRRHDEFVERLLAMGRDRAESGPSAVLRLRLRNALAWLEEHIDGEDRLLGRHAVAAGLARRA